MEELRIGVFVCHCGTNIAGFLDPTDVANYAKGLPDVVFTRENLFSCSEAGLNDIKQAIVENNLNRVVVAACTPRTHEPTFRAACEDAGLNPFYFEFVNIREHCTWVHKTDPLETAKKAKDLIRMGVARARLLEPQTPIIADAEPSALVIGGGVAGLTAAVSLADRGFQVRLIEREAKLGGMLNRLYRLYPDDISASEFITTKIDKVNNHPLIDVYTDSDINNIRGYIGNYDVTITTNQAAQHEFKVGVIIVATGAVQYVPEDMYGYDGKHVIHQLELETLFREYDGFPYNDIVMITCVGSRIPERVYCSRICCMNAIKHAVIIKQRNTNARIWVLYRDLMCYGVANESQLRRAKQYGVRFINYSMDRPPEVREKTVNVYGSILGKELQLTHDLIVLYTPLVPQPDVERLSKLLKVPLDETKFFLEAHIKLRPIDFATDGIHVCGTARWPASTLESIHQSLGAAARASIPMTNRKIKVEPIVSVLADEDACRGCGLCASVCPYGAIKMIETPKGTKANMITVACKGCGTCGATCYKHAIKMSHYTDEQLIAQVQSAFIP